MVMAVKGTSTRAAQAERTRQQILVTAQRLFNEVTPAQYETIVVYRLP